MANEVDRTKVPEQEKQAPKAAPKPKAPSITDCLVAQIQEAMGEVALPVSVIRRAANKVWGSMDEPAKAAALREKVTPVQMRECGLTELLERQTSGKLDKHFWPVVLHEHKTGVVLK